MDSARIWGRRLFADYMDNARARRELVVQPRMGFSSWSKMRRGLEAVAAIEGRRVGTITVDSFTRQGLIKDSIAAVRAGESLNGYPIVGYGTEINRSLLDGLHDETFPIQVRHGTPIPQEIFRAAAECGIDAIEGGPISYCLPYGRVPLAKSFDAWEESIRYWVEAGGPEGRPHVESFAGCMMGQLCPPALLVTLSILEGIFFQRLGVRSISLSVTQVSNFDQSLGATRALERLAREYLDDNFSHVVMYAYMGLFPRTRAGAARLCRESTQLAELSGAARLLVKTPDEVNMIPSIRCNAEVLRQSPLALLDDMVEYDEVAASRHEAAIYSEASERVAEITSSGSLQRSILRAFATGELDVPYCIHPDNANAARVVLEEDGSLRWRDTRDGGRSESAGLLEMLSFMARRYDNET